MAKKKKKKKKVLRRLAQKRGERSRRKKKVPKPVSAPEPTESEEEIQRALNSSAGLVYADELADIHFPPDELTSYLEETKKREIDDPKVFLKEGIASSTSPPFLNSVKERLKDFQSSLPDNDPRKAAAAVVVRAIETGLSPSSIPFFPSLFVRDVKGHPLSDDARIWKLIHPFLPSRILTPGERPTEEKTEYPHLIVPDSYKKKEGS